MEAGSGEKGIWKEIKGQNILGEESFVENLTGYIKGYKEMQEIPKVQRYINRLALQEVFQKYTLQDKAIRNRKMSEAVNIHGYSQREVADHLGIHYSTVSRLISQK